jgi:hypothetical protein
MEPAAEHLSGVLSDERVRLMFQVLASRPERTFCIWLTLSGRQHVHGYRIAAGAMAIGLGIAGAVIAGSPALAGPVSVDNITTHIVVGSATVAANETGEAEADCPAGQLLVGGGYRVTGTNTDWRIYLDAPTSAGTGWLVEPISLSAQPIKFAAYAVCAKSVAGTTGLSGYTTQVVDSQISAASAQTSEVDATCPAGELLTGGGYVVADIDSHWSVYLNAPTASGTWTAEIDNEEPVAVMFDSFAVCMGHTNSQPVTALTVNTVNASATAPANSVKGVSASCGSTDVLVGGGQVIDSIGQDWSFQVGAPTTSNTWRAKVSDLDTFPRTFHAVAMCLAAA